MEINRIEILHMFDRGNKMTTTTRSEQKYLTCAPKLQSKRSIRFGKKLKPMVIADI